MKHLITVTIEASSHSDLDRIKDTLNNSINAGRQKLNGTGARIRIGNTSGDNHQELMKTMGQLQWWSQKHQGPITEKVKKGFWSRMADEVNSIFDDDGEDLF